MVWKTTPSRMVVWLASGCGIVGLLIAVGGSLRPGALLFATAVALFGAGKLLAGGEDRAVSLVIFVVGVLSMIGVVGHVLTGL